MNKEDFFINEIKKGSKKEFIGDDGVLIEGFVYSQDAFFENVHFKREWFRLDEIAYKSMLVNISDAIVMNSVPYYALLTVALPKELSRNQLKELADGFLRAAKEFGIEIVGGDTISNTKIDISITLISKPLKKPIYRKGLKLKDYMAYTDTIGKTAKDLKAALRFNAVNKKSKLISPKLKPRFFYDIAKDIHVAMDISDGLFFELERLSRINRVGFRFFKKKIKNSGCSGEEYEILFGFDRRKKEKLLRIAKKHKIKLNIFATVIRGAFKNHCKAHHF